MKFRHLLLFIPILAMTTLFVVYRFIQYEPLTSPEERAAEVAPQNDVFIPLFADDPILGEKTAPKTIIAFEDFGCMSCAELDTLFEALLAKYPQTVKIIWKGLPVTRFPVDTTRAHEMAYCANKQGKFSEFKKMAFANLDSLTPEVLTTITNEIGLDNSKLTDCMASTAPAQYIEKTTQLGTLLNLHAVPAVFIDNKQIQTPKTLEEWEAALSLYE